MFSLENIHFSYDQKSPFIRNFSLSLQEGEKTALIGPNGSGKTTLFLLACGIIVPQEGVVRVDGKIMEPGNFNPELGYLFQSPDDQLFSSTVFDDVAFGPLNMGLRGEHLKLQVEDALERVGCGALGSRSSYHLSGGEKRMAAIGTLLSMSPRVMMFDEPTANLDNRNRRRVIRLIQNLPETLFISSHDLEFLLETCTRAILIDGGEIVAQGPIRELMNDHVLMERCGLEKPHSLVPHAVNHHH